MPPSVRAGSVCCRRFRGRPTHGCAISAPETALRRDCSSSRLGAVLLVAVVLGLGGCDRAEEDRAAQAAAEAVREANQALNKAGDAARKAGSAAREGADEAGRMLKDATLTARVKTALLADEAVPASRIDVDSNAGVVTLSGQLASDEQIQRALEIARKVDGVQRVDSKLTKG